MPADLHPRPSPKRPLIPTEVLIVIGFTIIFMIAVIVAWYGHGAYYYNMPLP